MIARGDDANSCDGTFLARLHEELYGYFRSKRSGLDHILRGAGFHVLGIAASGSIFSSLGHQLSTPLLTGTYRIPGVRKLAFPFSGLMPVLLCYRVDRLPGLRWKMPAGYVAAALKD